MLGNFLAWTRGELSGPESLELFAELVNTGYAWTLEGNIGREAARLIESGMLVEDPEGSGRAVPNPEYMVDAED